VLLLGVGQALNVGIYKAIGTAGVYYGKRLGQSVSWCHGFPFDSVSHPQYVGSVMSVWALAALLHGHVYPDVYILAIYWTALYVCTGVMEEIL
jgi:hypothetical protein